MTDEERIKSILAECDHGYISYDNLHGDNDQGIKLIAKACGKQLSKPKHKYQGYRCICGEQVARYQDYCEYCGQKLGEYTVHRL